MKNICKIFVNDWRRIRQNVVAVVIILGLIVIPSLYAWFNIFSNWDPYGESALSHMKIAVISDDKGAVIEDLEVNLGDKIVDTLKGNKAIGWVFPEDSGETIQDVYAGKYYAALLITENFSKNMTGILNGELEHPEIMYYENEKKNAIAPKITGKAQKAVKEEINGAILEIASEYLSKAFGVAENAGTDAADSLLTSLKGLQSDMNAYVSVLESLKGLGDTASPLIGQSQNMLNDVSDIIITGQDAVGTARQIEIAEQELSAVSDEIDKIIDLVNTGSSSAKNVYNEIDNSVKAAEKKLARVSAALDEISKKLEAFEDVEMVQQIKAEVDAVNEKYFGEAGKENAGIIVKDLETIKNLSEKAAADIDTMQRRIVSELIDCQDSVESLADEINDNLRPQVNATLNSMLDSVAYAQAMVKDANSDFSEVNSALSAYGTALGQSTDAVSESIRTAKDMQTKLNNLIHDIENIENSEIYSKIEDVINVNPKRIGEVISSPVNMDTVKVYEIANYGSAMSPFYTILSLWVGALIMVSLIHVKVLPEEGLDNVKQYQRFFGRYITFFLVGQGQTLLVVLGDLFFVGIECREPFLFWLASAISSFAFSLLVYSLTVAMGNIGEAVAVVLMVIQVAGAGCTFPIEVLPEVFQKFYAYMPFQFGMNALKETVGGMYGNDYWSYMGCMSLVALAALFIGLVLEYPCRSFNAKMEESKKSAEVML